MAFKLMQLDRFSDAVGLVVIAIIFVAFLFGAYATYCYVHWKAHFAPRKSKGQSISSGELPILAHEYSTKSSRVKKGASLNMDHLKVSYLQYLWGAFFIIPNMALLAFKGTSLMIIRRWLKKHGLDCYRYLTYCVMVYRIVPVIWTVR